MATKTISEKPDKTEAKNSKRAASITNTAGKGAVIGAVAAGAVAAVAAMVGRKVAVQAASAMSGDWFEALKTEHRMALAIFDQIEETNAGQTARRAVLLTQLKHALGKHAFQEENVIYPALRDHGDAEHADHLNHDHGYVKQYLFDLTELPKGSQLWLDKVREFRGALETHVREEEEEIFPALRSKLDAAHNKKLTTAMNKEGFKLA